MKIKNKSLMIKSTQIILLSDGRKFNIHIESDEKIGYIQKGKLLQTEEYLKCNNFNKVKKINSEFGC